MDTSGADLSVGADRTRQQDNAVLPPTKAPTMLRHLLLRFRSTGIPGTPTSTDLDTLIHDTFSIDVGIARAADAYLADEALPTCAPTQAVDDLLARLDALTVTPDDLRVVHETRAYLTSLRDVVARLPHRTATPHAA